MKHMDITSTCITLTMVQQTQAFLFAYVYEITSWSLLYVTLNTYCMFRVANRWMVGNSKHTLISHNLICQSERCSLQLYLIST